MSGKPSKEYSCVLCKKRAKQRDRRPVNKDISKFLRKNFLLETNKDDVLCNKCRHKYYTDRYTKSKIQATNPNESEDDCVSKSKISKFSPPSIHLPIPTLAKSHAYCVICKRAGPKLVVIPHNAGFQLFIQKNMLCPAGTRCCPVHLDGNSFTDAALENIKESSETSRVNRTTVVGLINSMRDAVLKTKHKRLDFDDPNSLSEHDYENLTGLSKNDFADLCNYIAVIQNTVVRSRRMSLAIFLVKHKSGMSNKMLSTIFNINKSSIRRAVASVRRTLSRTFVPEYLGINHVTRQDVISNHTRPLAQELFGNVLNPPVILVLDGTYIYIQKSNNFKFQRRSHSVMKGRPLLKLMVVVTTSGYFLSLDGPYLADSKNNDASILNHMLQTDIDGLKEWLEEDDVFVVDRGFRDSTDFLNDLGIKSHMPAFLGKGKKQMETDEANDTRLITKIRWVVESANARLKQWKYFAQVLPTTQVPVIGDSARIIAALCNKYKNALSSGQQESDLLLAAKMHYLSKQVNHLKSEIEEKQLDRRTASWKNIDACENLLDFPKISEDHIRDLTCGVYQLKLSKSYTQEHMDGGYDIQFHQENVGLIRCRIQSRHVTSKKHLLWIRYNEADITAWYCRCRAGSRVVGMCAHISSVIWYLGYARHTNLTRYGVTDWTQYVRDAADLPVLIDESDSDDSELNVNTEE